jgi:hypothetical protein
VYLGVLSGQAKTCLRHATGRASSVSVWTECDGHPTSRFIPSPVNGTPMSNAQDVDDPLLPVDINDCSVVANSNLEGLNGTEASQVSGRIHRNRP